MLDSLYAKTFLILGSQLGVTWVTTVLVLALFRRLYHARASWLSAAQDEAGRLDLSLDWDTVKPYFWALLATDVVVFILLLIHGQDDLRLGIPLFSFWSMLTGIELALALVAVDEHLGSKVLSLTALVTCAAGVIGARSGVDFSSMGNVLYASLLLLIAYGVSRLLVALPRGMQRLWAGFGAALFIGYLLFDFHRLSQLDEQAASNSWSTAMRMAISLYLDIINLFLQLLDLLSD
jgi:FtsH-binding integral membrane protein